MKTCPRCSKSLPESEFSVNRKSCRACLTLAAKYYAQRKLNNECVSCGKSLPLGHGSPLCKACRASRRAAGATAVSDGRCSRCRIKDALPGRKCCEMCATYFAERLKARPLERLFACTKHRAKRSGVPFTITYSDVDLPLKCPVFGTALLVGAGRRYNKDSPSLDRLNPTLGYVPGNVFVISLRANIIKNDGSAEEHRAIADYIDRMTNRV
jgi:hypothetical protein